MILKEDSSSKESTEEDEFILHEVAQGLCSALKAAARNFNLVVGKFDSASRVWKVF